jgi:molybdopterin-binding protein
MSTSIRNPETFGAGIATSIITTGSVERMNLKEVTMCLR